MIDNITKYLLKQMDKTTAWIGLIGLCLLFLGLSSFLLILFIALIVLPEGQISNVFKGWTKEIREFEQEKD